MKARHAHPRLMRQDGFHQRCWERRTSNRSGTPVRHCEIRARSVNCSSRQGTLVFVTKCSSLSTDEVLAVAAVFPLRGGRHDRDDHLTLQEYRKAPPKKWRASWWRRDVRKSPTNFFCEWRRFPACPPFDNSVGRRGSVIFRVFCVR